MKAFLIFIIFFITSQSIAGVEQEKGLHHYAQRNWRSVSGLTHDNVTSVFRDKNGFLWAGTIEGLTRIDGSFTKTFSVRTHPELLSNRIVAIAGKDDGTLFVATGNGISSISENGKVTKVIEEPDISSLAVLKSGEVFAAVKNELLMIFNGEIKRLSVLNGLPEGNVKALSGFENTLFGGTDTGSFFSYSNGEFTSDLCELNKNEITSSAVNNKGNVVFGTSAGEIFSYENSKCSLLLDKSGEIYDKNPVISISYRANSVRAVTLNSLIVVENNKKRHFKNCCNLPGTLSSVLFDEEKFLWVAGNNGLTLYYDGLFSTYGKEEGLSFEMVYAMVEDRQGTVWVGTRGGGIFYYSKEKFKQLSDKVPIPGNFVGGLMVDDKGEIWAGTSKGVVAFSPVQPFKIKRMETSRKKDVPLASVIFQDNSGKIWAGTASGEIYLFTKGKFTLVKEIGQEAPISAITQDSKGILWFATSKGLFYLEKEQFKVLTVENGLPDNWILSLYAAKPGLLFAGTMRKGLAIVMDDGKIHTLSTMKGLCSDTIFSIVKDSDDLMWFTSTQGIFSLPFQEVIDAALNREGSVKCFPFDSRDGIKRAECTGGVQPASMIRNDRTLWFPTIEGIAVINHTALPENVPHLSIDTILIDGKAKQISDVIKHKGEISLLEIQLTASRFIHPEQLNVKYILESHESEWNSYHPTEKRTVSYRKVSPGTYNFKITASNQTGETFSKEISFLVESTFVSNMLNIKWILVVLLFVLSLATIFVNRKKRRKKIILKESIKENIKENEVKDEEKKGKCEELFNLEEESDNEDYQENGEENGDFLENPKYNKSRLDDEIVECYATELETLMKKEKPYKNQDLTLPELAEKLGLSPNILSQVINTNYGKNFYNFINTYRVDEVVELMKTPSMKNRSILDLAYEAGFKSKTTFNAVFKKQMEVTPSEYKKILSEKK
ncbi:MAG: ligand-binding sensor domain-containing protein [bacterium]